MIYSLTPQPLPPHTHTGLRQSPTHPWGVDWPGRGYTHQHEYLIKEQSLLLGPLPVPVPPETEDISLARQAEYLTSQAFQHPCSVLPSDWGLI